MRGIELLHPEVRKQAESLVAEAAKEGLPVLITETFRTKDEQDKLYAQGRTAPGKIVSNAPFPSSAHCWGVAFDTCRNVKGKEFDDSDGFFSKIGAIGKRLGLFWGGDFKSIKDKPHFESPVFFPNNKADMLKDKYGTPEKFKATWNQ